eukprot:856920-Pelagomonas_calceolata.AAC.6
MDVQAQAAKAAVKASLIGVLRSLGLREAHCHCCSLSFAAAHFSSEGLPLAHFKKAAKPSRLNQGAAWPKSALWIFTFLFFASSGPGLVFAVGGGRVSGSFFAAGSILLSAHLLCDS